MSSSFPHSLSSESIDSIVSMLSLRQDPEYISFEFPGVPDESVHTLTLYSDAIVDGKRGLYVCNTIPNSTWDAFHKKLAIDGHMDLKVVSVVHEEVDNVVRLGFARVLTKDSCTKCKEPSTTCHFCSKFFCQSCQMLDKQHESTPFYYSGVCVRCATRRFF